VLDHAVRFVLGNNTDAPDTRIQAIGQREIDNANLPPKVRLLGTPVRKLLRRLPRPPANIKATVFFVSKLTKRGKFFCKAPSFRCTLQEDV